jgi:alpha-1,3-rhamnosyl/mannosyltransferase
MASGVPVLSSNASCLPEVLGTAALQVDPLDEEAITGGLQRVLMDEPWRAEAIAAGLSQASRYTWAQCVEQTLAVYQRALQL